MGKIIEVTPEVVEKAAEKIKAIAEQEYYNNYTAVYSLAEQLDKTWTGKDYQSFLGHISEYKTALDHMKELMEDFAAHCSNSAKAYIKANETVDGMTKSLPTNY